MNTVHERLVMNLTLRARDAIRRRTVQEGSNKTAVVCRAVQVYDEIMSAQERGAEVSIKEPGGEIKILRVL